MDCVACGSAAVTERPECTARGYSRFRCWACGKQYNERSGGLLNHTCTSKSLVARLRLANREFHRDERKLDELCTALTRAVAGESGLLPDAAILASLPGVGRSTPAILLTEAAGPLGRRDRAALRTLSAWRR